MEYFTPTNNFGKKYQGPRPLAFQPLCHYDLKSVLMNFKFEIVFCSERKKSFLIIQDQTQKVQKKRKRVSVEKVCL